MASVCVFYRVSPGKCYHLYNGLRASLLDPYQLPEIMRTSLEELCLQIKVGRCGGEGEGGRLQCKRGRGHKGGGAEMGWVSVAGLRGVGLG